jgi:hypothetical protein
MNKSENSIILLGYTARRLVIKSRLKPILALKRKKTIHEYKFSPELFKN